MFCVHCGAEVAEDELFCPFCGKKLSLEDIKDEPLEQGKTAVLSDSGQAGQAGEETAAPSVSAADGTVVMGTLPLEEGQANSAGGQEASVAPQSAEDLTGLTVFVNPNPSAAPGAGETQEFAPVAGQKMNASDAGAVLGSGVASGAGAASPQGLAEPAPKKPRNIVAVVVAAVAAVLLLAGVGIFALGGNADAAEVSVVTRIMPKDESGSALKDYTAQIEAEDGSRYQTRVQGLEGFTYADFGKIPYGLYTLVIVNNNGDTYGPYKTVYKENTGKKPKPNWDPVNDPTGKADNGATGKVGKIKKDEKTEKVVEKDIEELRKAAYAAYYEKCQEYMALTDGTVGEERTHGDPDDEEDPLYYGDGLILADLIDFNGDGLDELLVSYYDETKVVPDPVTGIEDWTDGFQVEVWEYKDNTLASLYTGLATPKDAGVVRVQVSYKDKTPGIYSEVQCRADEPQARMMDIYDFWYFKDGYYGSDSLKILDQWGDPSYYDNEGEISKSNFDKRMEGMYGLAEGSTVYFLTDSSWEDSWVDYYKPEEGLLLDEVFERTRETLNTLKGDAAGETEEESEGADSTDSEEVITFEGSSDELELEVLYEGDYVELDCVLEIREFYDAEYDRGVPIVVAVLDEPIEVVRPDGETEEVYETVLSVGDLTGIEPKVGEPFTAEGELVFSDIERVDEYGDLVVGSMWQIVGC